MDLGKLLVINADSGPHHPTHPLDDGRPHARVARRGEVATMLIFEIALPMQSCQIREAGSEDVARQGAMPFPRYATAGIPGQSRRPP
jgi:hypothetical protein